MTEPAVEVVFAALGDGTRRAIYEHVVNQGPVTATELTETFPISRQAITKHLDRLAAAGLATSAKHGREMRWQADTAPLSAAVTWAEEVGSAWDRRLERLAKRFEKS